MIIYLEVLRIFLLHSSLKSASEKKEKHKTHIYINLAYNKKPYNFNFY